MGSIPSESQFGAEFGRTQMVWYTAWQDIYELPTSGPVASTVYITGNSFHASQAANAVFLADYEPTPSLSAVMSGNTFTIDSSCGCYNGPGIAPPGAPVVVSWYLANIVASQNRIYGEGTGSTSADGIYITGGPGMVSGNTITGDNVGVWVDYANGLHVTGNTILNSATWGIALTDGSSYNSITRNIVYGSGTYDLYWDGSGTGNVWCGNFYHTSYPSILPSC